MMSSHSSTRRTLPATPSVSSLSLATSDVQAVLDNMSPPERCPALASASGPTAARSGPQTTQHPVRSPALASASDSITARAGPTNYERRPVLALASGPTAAHSGTSRNSAAQSGFYTLPARADNDAMNPFTSNSSSPRRSDSSHIVKDSTMALPAQKTSTSVLSSTLNTATVLAGQDNMAMDQLPARSAPANRPLLDPNKLSAISPPMYQETGLSLNSSSDVRNLSISPTTRRRPILSVALTPTLDEASTMARSIISPLVTPPSTGHDTSRVAKGRPLSPAAHTNLLALYVQSDTAVPTSSHENSSIAALDVMASHPARFTPTPLQHRNSLRFLEASPSLETSAHDSDYPSVRSTSPQEMAL